MSTLSYNYYVKTKKTSWKTIIFSLFIILSLTTPILNATDYTLDSDYSDIEERISDGSILRESVDLDMAYDTYDSPDKGLQIIGLRFNNVSIPQGATITSATIRFRAYGSNSTATDLLISGELSNDSSSFERDDYELSNRTKTESKVSWSPAAWSIYNYYNTDDISSIVQEIVDQPGYAGDDLSIFIEPGASCTDSNCQRRAYSHDKSSSSAAILQVEYVIAPTITPETFTTYENATVNTDIGTLTTSGSPTSFSILSGNIDNLFSIDDSGNLTVKTVIEDNNSTNSYDLNISATNSVGTDSEIITILISPPLTETTGGRDFTQRGKYNVFGDVEVIGNTVLCILNSDGQCEEPSNDDSNSYTDLQKAPQSYSTLTLPPNAVVEYARIYWQGRKAATLTDEAWDDSSKIAAGKIKIKKGSSGTFTELSADVKDFSSTKSYNYIKTYSAAADASSIVDESGTYYIDTSNFYTSTGKTMSLTPNDGLGNYGAWVLVVVYSDPKGTVAKNVTIFDGYLQIEEGDEVDISVSGFLTPKTGDVDSKTYVFAAEGDKYLIGTDDVIKMAGATYNTTLETLGTFNSSINLIDTRDPNLENNNGIDIHIYDTGTTSGAKNIITNYETGANFQFTSDQDTYFPSLIVFSTELYSPKFCYDYSYKQQEVYFTEDNNGSFDPRISGEVIPNEPIEVTMYIKNLVDSDIAVTDMFVDIYDINTSQAPYIPDSTKLAKIGDIVPVDIPDSLLNVGTTSNGDYVNNIEIGTIDTDAYFYIYYSVDPQVEDINMSIDVQARYNILIDGKYIPYTLKVGSQIPMCSSTNFTYLPTLGIFNVVHNNYYNLDSGGSNQYYNLPTQVSSREGNFKVLALDQTDPQYNTLLSDHNTSIFAQVELIDAAAFHDTEASCQEYESSISEKIWVRFDAYNSSTPFDATAIQAAITSSDYRGNMSSSSEFYENARENAAFRISYYVRDSNDSTLPDFTKAGDTYTNTWAESFNGENCAIDMDVDANGNSTGVTDDTVANWCQSGNGSSTSSGLSESEARDCLRCIYGDEMQFVCSRDNFAIRPEAFLINLEDQNQDQNLTTQKLPLTTGFSGSVGASAPALNLAAGYNYIIDVNATNYISNSASPGYTRAFSKTLLVPDDFAQYTWDPSQGATISGCNDDGNMTTAMKFLNGRVDTNSSLSQVGEYELTIQDSLWTTVDNDPIFMTHHTGNYFLSSSIPDCALNSSTVFPVNTAIDFSNATTRENSLTGCNISSNHTAPTTNIRYNNINVVSHPYQLSMTGITPSVGLSNTAINPNSFVYMSDMNATPDNNMSFHLNGTISAVGFDGGILSNFVNNCYAEPVSLTLAKTDANDTVIDYRYRYYNSDIPANDQNGSLNTATDMITLQASDFNGSNGGLINIRLNLNFDRNITLRNPESITYSTFDSNASSIFNADLATTNLRGSRDLNNSSIAHYYGRTHAARQRFVGNQGVTNIYYEIYCFETIDGNTCDKTLLPDGLNSGRTNDLRWYINTQHNASNDGKPGLISQQDGSGLVTTTVPTLNNIATSTLTYDESLGYPYKTTMENNASSWLIYNDTNANATTNEFSVEFEQIGGSWSGQHETNTTTNDANVTKTNRRSMW